MLRHPSPAAPALQRRPAMPKLPRCAWDSRAVSEAKSSLASLVSVRLVFFLKNFAKHLLLSLSWKMRVVRRFEAGSPRTKCQRSHGFAQMPSGPPRREGLCPALRPRRAARCSPRPGAPRPPGSPAALTAGSPGGHPALMTLFEPPNYSQSFVLFNAQVANHF